MANIGCSDAKREREASRELKSLEAVNAVKVAALEYDDFAKKLEFAEDGSADAQKSVGLMYATGKGVDKDLSKSFFWYKSAAEQGLRILESFRSHHRGGPIYDQRKRGAIYP
jgi:TPR repeat protein